MKDAKLLEAAIEVTDMSQRGFAVEVLGFQDNGRQVRRWLAGTSALHPTVRLVCTAILAEPAVAELLRAAWADRAATLRKTPRRRKTI